MPSAGGAVAAEWVYLSFCLQGWTCSSGRQGGRVGVRGALLASGMMVWSTLHWFIPRQMHGHYQKPLGFGAVAAAKRKICLFMNDISFFLSVQVTCFQRSCCAPCSGHGLLIVVDCRPQVCFLLGSRGSVDGRTSGMFVGEQRCKLRVCISAPRWLAKPGDACVALPKTLVTWSLPLPLAPDPKEMAYCCYVSGHNFSFSSLCLFTKLSPHPRALTHTLGAGGVMGARPGHPHSQEGHSGRHPFPGGAAALAASSLCVDYTSEDVHCSDEIVTNNICLGFAIIPMVF